MGLFSSEIAAKKMVPLCRQLATAYEAGIPVLKSFEIVGGQERDPKVRQMFLRMHDRIAQGGTLADAARAESRYLPTFFVELMASGESGGKLDVMLQDLAQYYEDRLEMRRRIVRMMTLPGIELCAAWFFGTFALRMLGYALKALGSRGGAGSFSQVFTDYARFQGRALTLFAAGFACCVILARLGLFKWISGGFKTFVWPIAPIARRLALSRFFRSMSLLLGSGMNVLQCIERSAAVMANPYLERDMLKAIPLVRDGATLTEAFLTSRCLTSTAREMLAVGEESGKLEMTLRKVSEYHMAEASHATDVATRVTGVLVVLVVGAIVGYVIITFYTKLYGGILNELGV